MTDTTLNGPLTTDGIEDTKPPATEEAAPAAPRSKARRALTTAAWVGFALFCLITFTLLKLPDDRIKAYVQGMIAAQLAPRGITFTADKGYVSIGLGFSYVMKDVTLTLPPPQPALRIEKVVASPSILPMLLGYQGGSIALYNGDGKLSGSVSIKGTQMSGSFSAKQLDLGKTGLLQLGAGLNGGGMVSGSGDFSGDMSAPSTLSGDVSLDLSKVVLDAQPIAGFSVPRIAISEGNVELSADKGKATIKTFKIGKAGSTDDLVANASGDVVLGRNWDSSTLNAKVNFKLSDTVMKAFILLDALIGAGKQGDGSYSLHVTGPVTAPNPVPVPPGAK